VEGKEESGEEERTKTEAQRNTRSAQEQQIDEMGKGIIIL